MYYSLYPVEKKPSSCFHRIYLLCATHLIIRDNAVSRVWFIYVHRFANGLSSAGIGTPCDFLSGENFEKIWLERDRARTSIMQYLDSYNQSHPPERMKKMTPSEVIQLIVPPCVR